MGYDYYEDANTVNVHIHRIREKLEKHDFYPTLLQLYGDLVISLKGADNYFFNKVKSLSVSFQALFNNNYTGYCI